MPMSFQPLWDTMEKKGISSYDLILKMGFPRTNYYRIKSNKDIRIETIEKLCQLLDCEVQDIVKYEKDAET